MEVHEKKTGNYLVISLSGRLDSSNYGELEKKLFGFIEDGEVQIVVDCTGLIYISSSGLRVLLMALKKLTSVGGKFYLCSLQTNIREIFDIAGFSSIFRLFETVDQAMI
jgi:anti-anti-sigma factor